MLKKKKFSIEEISEITEVSVEYVIDMTKQSS